MTKDEIRMRQEEILNRIAKGEVFIYPTDTIYGLGCDATNAESVKKIRTIKQRPDTPFSVIAPSVDWIRANCVVTKDAEKYIKELPGPVTLILKLKNPKCVSKEVHPGGDTLGVRIPKHWISQMVKFFDIPIVTTSVNITDKPFMTDIEELDPEIEGHTAFALYEGAKEGRPSKIIHLEGTEVTIKER